MTFAELFSSAFTTTHAEEAESISKKSAAKEPAKESAAKEPADKEKPTAAKESGSALKEPAADPTDDSKIEEEPEDPKPAIMEAALETKQCAPLKHHLDECTQRVEEGSHENCIEEFFHLMHCQDNYAAPKIFVALK